MKHLSSGNKGNQPSKHSSGERTAYSQKTCIKE
jgi:hypothetical protein